MAKLLHAMGDVHPHALKASLARELSRITFERWSELFHNDFPPRAKAFSGKTLFCNSGFEAVEAALKTALLATGKPGVIAFEGAYHGLGYGALNTTHREHFRHSFLKQLGHFGKFVSYPMQASRSAAARSSKRDRPTLDGVCAQIERLLRDQPVGAILVEPIQVRGGINIPPLTFLRRLRSLCNRFGAVLILDEIYTGFGRTGRWFACEHSKVIPDLICLGKALTGGFPLSACVGRADLMDRAWPPSQGEAIHTSTFLGHPVGCAMALAQIREIQTRHLVRRSDQLGSFLLSRLSEITASPSKMQLSVRGLGLLAGLEIRQHDASPAGEAALACIKALLKRGFIFLPEGPHANVISFTPPLTISKRQLETAVQALEKVLATFEKS
jgi:4-aminobutyrate aminotransferase-like enzyme